MGWEQWISLLSVVSVGGLGLLTYLRGRRSDRAAESAADALDVATNIKTNFEAYDRLIEALQEDIATQRGWLHACEESCRQCRRELEERTRLFYALERELANAKTLLFEQEQTIARHERTINAISRRSDHQPKERQGDEERRQPLEDDPDEPTAT